MFRSVSLAGFLKIVWFLLLCIDRCFFSCTLAIALACTNFFLLEAKVSIRTRERGNIPALHIKCFDLNGHFGANIFGLSNHFPINSVYTVCNSIVFVYELIGINTAKHKQKCNKKKNNKRRQKRKRRELHSTPAENARVCGDETWTLSA